ncbi:clamp loader small subunit [uncultured Caudovirales phage]|uniref:Clamp loader small subunit n=1 Tax=uncultured Caudovirales phage TaxID=2100421 RepID=A0A6J5LFR5_9CAUD|nr:clamp loader small subunit [uncultured Caudovirales phage]
MPDLFKEIIPSILEKKKNVFQAEHEYKDYTPYVVNRALSFHQDCVPYVNEINVWCGIDKDMQYQYLLNTIRTMKRKFQPWQKTSVDKDIDCVKEYFGYSNEKAKEALRILTDEQIKQIKEITNKGGISK